MIAVKKRVVQYNRDQESPWRIAAVRVNNRDQPGSRKGANYTYCMIPSSGFGTRADGKPRSKSLTITYRRQEQRQAHLLEALEAISMNKEPSAASATLNLMQ